MHSISANKLPNNQIGKNIDSSMQIYKIQNNVKSTIQLTPTINIKNVNQAGGGILNKGGAKKSLPNYNSALASSVGVNNED